MIKKTDPFTRTPGIAGRAYIDNGIADEIINNFCDEESSKFVYKITGLRGSGKSVEYSKVIRTLKERKDWLVYTLSASGEAVSTLISRLSMEKFIDSKSSKTELTSTARVEGNILFAKGNESINIKKAFQNDEHFFSYEAMLSRLVSQANKKGYNILVGIDDISKTDEMVKLLSIIGSMILEGLKIYLIVTGLTENIESDEAKKLEEMTKGYAYAYQVLGSLYFGKQDTETIKDIIPDYERILFRDSYELIWKSLTLGERDMVRCIFKSENGKTDKIKAIMNNPSNYSMYRHRLINKHIVNADTRGYLTINLPYFDKYKS